ncbi:hypothetical protein [Xenorhabdus sp. KJ12.1]|uniref:hypothetical protein n=1 Tax=Xenorhabdus sp. KJ12.1 TaxID=1851571 RepID=UPI00187C598D|nr:hypothetical protein [Xenorhabdus sp. KJ12.1]
MLALVLLLNCACVVTIREQHNAAIHNHDGECATNIESGLLKPLHGGSREKKYWN